MRNIYGPLCKGKARLNDKLYELNGDIDLPSEQMKALQLYSMQYSLGKAEEEEDIRWKGHI